jgi:beta-lactamase class A
MQELVQKMNELCDERPYACHWYLKDLRTGESADRFGDVVVPSASVRKISIMMAALKQVNDGVISLDQPFELQKEYQGAHQPGGGFEHLWPGFTMPFYNAMVMMIILSDNTCTHTICDIVGVDYLNEYSKGIGMVGTLHVHRADPDALKLDHDVTANNATTAVDVGMLLETILKGTTDEAAASKLGVTPELCEMAIDVMKKQKMTGKIPALLPEAATVAHKTGTGSRNNNDAGIVYENGEPRYILSFFSDGVPRWRRDGPGGQTAASAHVARVSRLCWDVLVEGKTVEQASATIAEAYK